MSYVFPVLIFMLTVSFAAALSLYWFVGGLVAYLQQAYLLKKDEENLEGNGTVPAAGKNPAVVKKAPIEAEIISETPKKSKTNKAKKTSAKRKKRR